MIDSLSKPHLNRDKDRFRKLRAAIKQFWCDTNVCVRQDNFKVVSMLLTSNSALANDLKHTQLINTNYFNSQEILNLSI